MIAKATTFEEERRLHSQTPISREKPRLKDMFYKFIALSLRQAIGCYGRINSDYTPRQQNFDLERRLYVDRLPHTD